MTGARMTERFERDMVSDLIGNLADYAVLLLDEAGLVRTWNAGAERIKGYRAPDVLGRHLSTFYTAEDNAAGVPQRHLQEAAAQGRLAYEGWRVRADGSLFWADVVITALHDEQGRFRGYGKVTRDLTERKMAQQALADSEALHRMILQKADEAIALVDVAGRFTYVNPALLGLLDASPDDVLGHSVAAFLCEPDRERVMGELMAGRLPEGRREVRLITAAGATAYGLMAVTRIAEDTLLVLLTDVTAQREAERQRAHDLLHDRLTGLPNSRLARDRIERARSRRSDTAVDVAAVLLDVDGFRHVNLIGGRDAGDGVLMAVAAALASELSASDTLARWGSDEFLVLREGVLDASEASALAGRLMATVAEVTAAGPFPVTLSAGVSLVGAGTAETAVSEAEAALAQAKAAGHGRSRMYRPALAAVASLPLPAELGNALREDQLVVHYQPLVDLASGRPLALEALLRWHHPRDGLLGPPQFLPLAEAAGLMTEIDMWVLETACRDLAGRKGTPLPVGVNFAPDQLLAPDAADAVLDVLARTGLPPSQLVLEITEHALVEDVDAAVHTMSRLRAAGVRMALDDFGTGYSGLSHLRTLPVDALKIDRSFIAAVDEPDARAIISSVLSLASSIGLPAVAEGVETSDQRRSLLALGCQIAQGYLFSPGVPYDQIDIVCSRLAAEAEERHEQPRPAGKGRRFRPQADLSPKQQSRIVQLHESGASLATIAARLNSEGLRRPDGRRWHAVFIARALQALMDET